MENITEEMKSTERSSVDRVLENTFQRLYQKWNEETMNISNSDDMFRNKYYKAIIEMGRDAVPHIINQLRRKPNHLFDALMRITKANPIKPNHAGRIKEMAKDWIEWYDNEYNKE
jgi:hypothetical protein